MLVAVAVGVAVAVAVGAVVLMVVIGDTKVGVTVGAGVKVTVAGSVGRRTTTVAEGVGWQAAPPTMMASKAKIHRLCLEGCSNSMPLRILGWLPHLLQLP